MKKIILLVLMALMIQGCSTAKKKPTVKVFDRGDFAENELVSVSGCSNDGENVYINKVNRKETSSGWFDGWPDTIKLPPGTHTLEIYYSDSRFSLRTDLKSFTKNVRLLVKKGHKYEICISVKKSGLLAATIKGWVEDKTTGKKVDVF